MYDVADRFSNPYTDREYRGAVVWNLRGTRTDVIQFAGKQSYAIRFPNGKFMQNDNAGSRRSFRKLEAAMSAAIEHHGG